MAGGVPSPLQYTEIMAFAELEGWDEPESAFRMFVDVIRKLDDAYLRLVSKRQEEERAAEKAKSKWKLPRFK
jgi:hypothetical protein